MTGLIYVAIVALWAAVLIPMWLRRHDDDQARRIDRHRVAMGTLARLRGSEDADATARAAHRRRLALAALATVGAIGTAAWLLGFAPGMMTIILWLPFLAFVPVSVLAHRAASRRAAERALAERRQERRSRRVDRPVREQAVQRSVRARPEVRVADRADASRGSAAWDDVFDQTA